MARQEIAAGKLRWIHIHQPTADDFAYVRSLHVVDELVMDYLSTPTLHPSLEEFGDHLYFILHFPVIYRSNQDNQAIEVDFLMTKNILITVTYEKYDRLDKLFRTWQQDEKLQAKNLRRHSGFVVYLILEHLYRQMIRDRDYIEETINRLERKVFASAAESLVEEISDLARDVLDFRRVFTTQSSVLTFLPQAMQRLFGERALPKFTNIVVTQDRIQRLIDNHKETIDALQSTHTALIDSRISRIVKVLTIFSALILPLSFLASVWGMNQRVMPWRDGPYDFWLVVGLMLAIMLAMIAGFRKAKWL